MQKDTIVEISILQCQKIPEEMRIGLEKYFSSFGNSKESIFLIQKPLKKQKTKKMSHVSRIVPKTLRGSFGVFQHPFCYKLSNFKGTLWRHFRKKSHSKNEGGPFCFGMVFISY